MEDEPMPKMTGARLFAEMMRDYEVSHIFFVPAFMLKSFAEMEDMPIARIMVHGEKAAAYMADGYARASGKPGVCMAQMIGASNLAAGLRDAHMAGAPVIAITGGPTPQSRYKHAYHGIRAQEALARMGGPVPAVAVEAVDFPTPEIALPEPRARRAHQEADVDPRLRQPATEVPAGATGAEHEQPHQLRSPTPFLNSHRPSAARPTTKASISAYAIHSGTSLVPSRP